ncbi:MAG: OsmC family protein [Candidatus Dactylopiibacterium sp.]|nr:OsmC family protein [Candidatus Dactylopiibacterium sp.]
MTAHAHWAAGEAATQCQLRMGDAAFEVDADPAAGGRAGLPVPHDLLDAALAACTTLTLTLYARHKGFTLEGLGVEVSHARENGATVISRRILLPAGLADDVAAALLRVAEACPVHKTLSAPLTIRTVMGRAPA